MYVVVCKVLSGRGRIVLVGARQMEYKGKAERPDVDPSNYDVGDMLTIEIGEWNGSGFRFTNYTNEHDYLVVSTSEDKITVVRYDQRLDWIEAKSDWSDYTQNLFETRIHKDGDVSTGVEHVVMSIKKWPHRGGEHMVTHGLE